MAASGAQERTLASPAPPGGTCPLTAALEVLGGRWNLIVLYWLTVRLWGHQHLQHKALSGGRS